MGRRKTPEQHFEQGIITGFKRYSNGKIAKKRLYGEKTLSWDEYCKTARSLHSTKAVLIHAAGNGNPIPGIPNAPQPTVHQASSSTPHSTSRTSPSSPSARSNPIMKSEHNTVEGPVSKPPDELPTKEAIKEQIIQRIRERKVAEEQELQAQKEARAAESKKQCYIIVMDLLGHIPGLNCLLHDPAQPHANIELSYDAESILRAITRLTEWDVQMKSIQELTTASVRKLDMMNGLEILSNNAMTLVEQISGLVLRATELRLVLEEVLFLLEK